VQQAVRQIAAVLLLGAFPTIVFHLARRQAEAFARSVLRLL